MASIEIILEAMKRNPRNIAFKDLLKICIYYFGEPRIRGSHHYFTTSWQGHPIVNIQKLGAQAKPYQVRQVLAAITRLGEENERSE